MARKQSLDVESLTTLGAGRLAELLVELTDDDEAARRRLRLEVAGTRGPNEAAREVSKRLAAIRRSRSFVDRRRVRPLAADLEMQRQAIVKHVADRDPDEGVRLMWRFPELANSVYGRIDDSDGMLTGTFRAAGRDLGRISVAAGVDPRGTADRVYEALSQNHYGQYDDLITDLAEALGESGLDRLHARLTELKTDEGEEPLATTARMAIMQIADARGDVDLFVDQYDEETRRIPRVAAEIARRMLDAGRAEEALEILDASRQRGGDWVEYEWEAIRIEVLDALGRKDDAQDARWAAFERRLDGEYLREYLRRYDGFDGVDLEARALAHAQQYRDAMSGLSFLISWPAPNHAAALVAERADELDGNCYWELGPAAETLSSDHPIAATLLLRAMIDFTLGERRSTRYRHAARHIRECAALESGIDDLGSWEGHEAYVGRLRSEHARKNSFWKLVGKE